MSRVIVAGNGVSLRKHPREFLEKYPLFGMNYLPYYTDLKMKWWTAWDAQCLEDNLPKIPDETTILLRDGLRERVKSLGYDADYARFFFVVPYPPNKHYSSSLLWAIDLVADSYRYNEILLVGFDCTTGNGVYLGKGKGAVPHFYDPKPEGETRYAEAWDRQIHDKRVELFNSGIDLINISPGSKSRLLPARDWREYEQI